MTNSLAGLDVNSYAEPGTSSRRPQSERTASQVSEGVPGGRSQGSGKASECCILARDIDKP